MIEFLLTLYVLGAAFVGGYALSIIEEDIRDDPFTEEWAGLLIWMVIWPIWAIDKIIEYFARYK